MANRTPDEAPLTLREWLQTAVDVLSGNPISLNELGPPIAEAAKGIRIALIFELNLHIDYLNRRGRTP